MPPHANRLQPPNAPRMQPTGRHPCAQVIGVGGGGGNALNRMIEADLQVGGR
jgi:cell division GTPase FtsZ